MGAALTLTPEKVKSPDVTPLTLLTSSQVDLYKLQVVQLVQVDDGLKCFWYTDLGTYHSEFLCDLRVFV